MLWGRRTVVVFLVVGNAKMLKCLREGMGRSRIRWM
jgi:hypothetical protein